MRRTQRERKEATITRLFDAGIATIDELGYARASVNAIAARAGLSYGALFRHFATMSDFMAALAREAVRRKIERLITGFREAAGKNGRTDLETCLELWRAMSGDPEHMAILELTMAARTDEFLRESMQESMVDAGTAMVEMFEELVGRELDLTQQDRATLVFMLADLFDGEVFQHPLRANHPEISTRRIPLLLQMLGAGSSLRSGPSPDHGRD